MYIYARVRSRAAPPCRCGRSHWNTVFIPSLLRIMRSRGSNLSSMYEIRAAMTLCPHMSASMGYGVGNLPLKGVPFLRPLPSRLSSHRFHPSHICRARQRQMNKKKLGGPPNLPPGMVRLPIFSPLLSPSACPFVTPLSFSPDPTRPGRWWWRWWRRRRQRPAQYHQEHRPPPHRCHPNGRGGRCARHPRESLRSGRWWW